MMMRRLLFLLLMTFAIHGLAEERILNFHSNIKIHETGDMTVTESITVNAEGNKIERGIYRDFPTRYKDRYGNSYNVGFTLEKVLRDGSPEGFHTKKLSNGIRIYIGKADRYLNKGQYTYEITYHTNRQIGFFEDHDELYWNVTGNDWDFPIDKASAKVTLPDTLFREDLKGEAYTGYSGSTDRNYVSSPGNDASISFNTTAALAKKEGLTIVVSWPKGHVTEPTDAEKINYLLKDNRHLIVALVGIIILLAYYLLNWIKVGKDPEKGIIIPHYEPPAGYSPASLRFVLKKGYDNTCFAVAIINLAVKGFLKIEENNNEYSLELTGKDDVEMAPGEAAIVKNLFGKDTAFNMIVESPKVKSAFKFFGVDIDDLKTTDSQTKIVLKRSNHQRIGAAVSAHTLSLQNDYEKKYFMNNTGYFVFGLFISFVLLVATVLFQPGAFDPAALFMLAWLSGWSVAVVFLVITVFRAWSNINGFSSAISAVFTTLFAVPFIAGELFGLYFLIETSSISVGIVLVVVVLINLVFYELLKAPTLAGRELLDKIEGFKQYIDIAERAELDFKHPKGRSPELFEKYLPYALALGVEQQWGESFADVLAQANAHTSDGYTPAWYHGSHWHSTNIGTFTSSLGSGFTSAIASSSTAPGSSSGSSGSSGGGGGGGGGGGW